MRQALREMERTDETLHPVYDSHFEAALSEIIRILGNAVPSKNRPRFYAIAFERDKELSEQLVLSDFQKRRLKMRLGLRRKSTLKTQRPLLLIAL